MQPTQPNLLLRNDTILGVCEAIGQDFGFHANWLRLLFASFFYINPLAVTGAYLALGVLVAVTRWAAPNKVVPASTSHQAENESEALQLAA